MKCQCGKEIKPDRQEVVCGQVTVNGVMGYLCECGVSMLNTSDVEFIQEIERRADIPEDKEIVITLDV